MKKKMLIWLLGVMVFWAISNTVAFAQVGGTCGETLIWSLDSGTLIISGEGDMEDYFYTGGPWGKYSNAISRVVIDGGVTSIGNYAFYDCENITDITIPEGLIRIGTCAFGNCRNLTDVVIPSSVTCMESGAFMDCISLTKIEIPSGINTISDGILMGCSGLKNIKSPDSVKRVEEFAFCGCYGLTDMLIPSGVTEIEKGMFQFCEGLVSIAIHENIKSIGERAFSGCVSLKDVYYKDFEEQWEQMKISSDNDELLNAKIQYGSIGEMVDIQVEKKDGSITVFVSTQGLPDGSVIKFAGYNYAGVLSQMSLAEVVDHTARGTLGNDMLYKVKAFFWEDDNIKPICAAKEDVINLEETETEM